MYQSNSKCITLTYLFHIALGSGYTYSDDDEVFVVFEYNDDTDICNTYGAKGTNKM